MGSTTRTRWAAVGAAVAVTLGAGGIGITQATSSDGGSAYFPLEPCRVAAAATIAEDSSIVLDGWGDTGECTIPDGAAGLAANVTAVDATEQTNLRFYPDGDPVPETANLNPTPDAPPIPNAVNISLSETDGKFRVYNRFGSVDVFIDVMGYFDGHTHDDRYYTKEQVDASVDGDRPIVSDLSYTASDVATPTANWQLMQTVGTFDQVREGSTIRLDWSAHHSHPDAAETNYCHYQLRIDDATVDGNTALTAATLYDGGDAIAQSQNAQISTHAIFSGLDVGEHTVAIYVRGGATSCTLNPGTLLQQLTVTEFTAAD